MRHLTPTLTAKLDPLTAALRQPADMHRGPGSSGQCASMGDGGTANSHEGVLALAR